MWWVLVSGHFVVCSPGRFADDAETRRSWIDAGCGKRAVGRVRHRRLHDQAARRRSGPLRPHADLPLLVRDTRSLPSGWDLAAIPWALARPLVRGHGSAHRYRVCARESYQHRGVRRHVRLRRLLWRRVVGDAAYGLAPGLLRRGAVLRAQAPRSRALRRLGASQPRYRRLLVRGRTHIYAGRHKYRGRRRCRRRSGQRARSKERGLGGPGQRRVVGSDPRVDQAEGCLGLGALISASAGLGSESRPWPSRTLLLDSRLFLKMNI
mmetsp:Transcript_30531/g.81444  ORF Transcript_30531/g.81444 Transcript_30531/m.81444 type:complete len:265 (+) Transcript_30531:1845-2639(+)